MKNLNSDRAVRSVVQNRLLLVILGVLAWTGAVFYKLAVLQVIRADEYRLRAANQQEGFFEITPHRGSILDRDGNHLAISVRGDSVYAQPYLIADPAATATALSPYLGLPADELEKLLSSNRRFVYLQRKIPPETASQIRDLHLQGVGVHEDRYRVYPHGRLAAHVLGFVGADNQGLAGLEYRYDSSIGGRRIRIDLRLDARRRSYQRESQESTAQGAHLLLTLDSSIQHFTQQVLAETVEKHQALGGSAIVMDPNTGAVLALASYPDFEPGAVERSTPEAMRNRVIQDYYEPGSTFKLITLAAVLNESLADLQEIVDCRLGTVRLGSKVFKEAHGSFHDLTVAQIIQKSSNVGTIKLALRLGEDRLYDYARRFGFGRPTGVDLPGESAGLLRAPQDWSRLSIGSIAIGQEIGVTALQMVRAISAVANGGYLVRPYLVQQIVGPEGAVQWQAEPERTPVISTRLAAEIRTVLHGAVEEGTGSAAKLRGYTSAGKTGTAQKAGPGGYRPGKYVASFIGFAPLENPALAAAVVIDEPKGTPYGGTVAAPAFHRIMERALVRCGVPQDKPIRLPAQRLDLVRKARSTPETRTRPDSGDPSAAFADQARADIDPVTSETATDLQAAAVSGEVPEVPDFRGESLRAVVATCARLGIRVRTEGVGVVVEQEPPPGSLLIPGMEVKIRFSRQAGASSAQMIGRRNDASTGTSDGNSR